MSLEQQFIFLFSALGSINGFLISSYFLFKRKERNLTDFFLGAMLLMLSFRVFKSVFRHFNSDLFEWFILFGLGCCCLIGPLLFLYVKSTFTEGASMRKIAWWHTLPFIIGFVLFSSQISYYDNRAIWTSIVRIIYWQWLVYILWTAYLLFPVFKKLFQKANKLSEEEFWILNVFGGTTIVWFAYFTTRYTSYIVGALSFTFILYLSLLYWFYKRSNQNIDSGSVLKYANSSLTNEEIKQLMDKLEQHMQHHKAFLDPELTVSKLGTQLGVKNKALSQAINQCTGENYSHYIARLRVGEAKKLLKAEEFQHYKISAIAFESGFNSLSSFNSYFKKYEGKTAKEYRNGLNSPI